MEESQDRAEDKGEAFTVRLHQPSHAKKRDYPDLVYGKIQRLKRSPAAPQTASEDDAAVDASDTILVKSDGTPTYHFANVVDDHLMQITHVIRGSEWMASTPLHYDIYSAFGWEPPQFAHVGLLVDQNKAKLSKRNQDLALDVQSMRDEHGVLPYTLTNFLALLGWSNPTDNDVMELEGLIRNFDLKFTRGNTMVRMEKLWFLQKQHVALRCQEANDTKSFLPVADVVRQVTNEVRRVHSAPLINAEIFSEVYYSEKQKKPDLLSAYCTEILLADGKSYQNARQFVERNEYFLAFDPAKVFAGPEYYNKAETLSGAFIHQIIKNGLERMTLHRKFDDEESENTKGLDELLGLHHLERVFHATLVESIWATVIADQVLFPDRPPFEGLANSGDLSEPFDRGLAPYTAEALDVEAVAKNLCKSALEHEGTENQTNDSGNPSIDLHEVDDGVGSFVSRYKMLNAGVMKYLRLKLAYGQPGPSMSMVMALLGREETYRRLGLPFQR